MHILEVYFNFILLKIKRRRKEVRDRAQIKLFFNIVHTLTLKLSTITAQTKHMDMESSSSNVF